MRIDVAATEKSDIIASNGRVYTSERHMTHKNDDLRDERDEDVRNAIPVILIVAVVATAIVTGLILAF
jgi:hypothetical protein